MYNMRLYVAFVAIILVLGFFAPLSFVFALIPMFLLILVRNMRFVQKHE